MLIHPGNHLGDSWYCGDGDTAHCFYLTCPDTVERHTSWDIGHATSTHLIDWTSHDIVLRQGEPGSYGGRCPATGSVIRFNERYWLAYTGKMWLITTNSLLTNLLSCDILLIRITNSY